MGLDLEKIKKRLQDAANPKKNSDFPSIFWKIPEGESVVRIVTPKNGDPFVEAFQHYNVGKNMPFLCPRKQFGEDCPVCQYVSELYKSKNPDDLALAKKLTVKTRYFSPVLVRGEEDKNIRWWSYSKTVYHKLLKTVNKVDEYGDITDPEQGTDLVIEYNTPEGASFPKTDFEVRRKTSPLCKDITPQKCEELMNTVPDINKGLNKRSTDDVKKMLDEWLLGGEGEEGGAAVHEDIEKGGNKKDENLREALASVGSAGVVEKKGEVNSIDEAFDSLLKD